MDGLTSESEHWDNKTAIPKIPRDIIVPPYAIKQVDNGSFFHILVKVLQSRRVLYTL